MERLQRVPFHQLGLIFRRLANAAIPCTKAAATARTSIQHSTLNTTYRTLKSCCSTDSERPHRCCHLLPNEVDFINRTPDIPYTISLQSAGRYAPKLPFPWGNPGLM